MANINSNKKRKRQDDKKNLKNKSIKNSIKTAIKKAESTKKEEDKNNAVKIINKAVSSNAIHKNKAARLVSKVQKIQLVNTEEEKNNKELQTKQKVKKNY